MPNEHQKHSTVGRSYEIDQRAIKIFLNWLPDNWIPRKQDPDFHIDFLVEIVDAGEPTGKLFGAQIKGFDEGADRSKPLSYPFKTKHLDYYLHRSQHPIFLFLINVTNRDGYWLFAQKFLKDHVSKETLQNQKSVTIGFATEDNLLNSAKFKCLLPEAERFVRDLHPGSPLAATQKRKMELEALDPRCAVDVSVSHGQEHIVIRPKEPFSFSMNVNSKNVDGWKALFEKGEMIKTTSAEVSFIGLPLFQDALNQSKEIMLQIAPQRPASINIINSNGGFPDVTRIDGTFTSGTKFFRFAGSLANSPLAVSIEVARENLDTKNPVDLSLEFSLSKWAGQPVLHLAAFEEIKRFAESFSGQENPKIELLVDGRRCNRGELGGKGAPIFQFINESLAWLAKCVWLAEYFKVNPILPALDGFSMNDFRQIEELHDILKFRKMVWPKPYLELSLEMEPIVGENIAPANAVKTLRVVSAGHAYNFFGSPITLPPIEHIFSEVDLFSRTLIQDGKKEKLIFKGNENSKQVSSVMT